MFGGYFGLRCSVMRGRALTVMHDDGDGMPLVLNDFEKRGAFAYPEDSDIHHIGSIQPSREDVDTLNARLKPDGWALPASRDDHGAWTFGFKAPGGYFIEVATQTQSRRAEPAAAA